MGNNNNKYSSSEIDTLIESKYKSLSRYYHQVYSSEITLLQQRATGRQYVLIVSVVQPQSQVAVNNASTSPNAQFLIPISESFQENIDLCSQAKRRYMLLEYEQNSLDQEIFIRQTHQNYFSKSLALELLLAYTNLVHTLDTTLLARYRWPISNNTVAFSSKNRLRIMDPLLLPAHEGAFYQLRYSDDPQRKYIWIAPQTMDHLRTHHRSLAQQVQMSDAARIFTLGISFLELLILIDASAFYDFRNFSIFVDQIEGYLGLVQSLHGQEITGLLAKMLYLQPSQRPTINQVELFLGGLIQNSNTSPYQKKIVQQQQQGQQERRQSIPISYRPILKSRNSRS